MKKLLAKCSVHILCSMLMLGSGLNAEAAEQTIKNGIYIGPVDVSGMTATEAEQAVETYVDSLKAVDITLQAANGGEVQVTAQDLGITWTNKEIIEEAAQMGQQGNVIVRYKMMKDLQHDNIRYDLEFAYDVNAINDILTNQCVSFDTKAVDSGLTRENGAFVVKGGQNGYQLDVEHSIDAVNDYLVEEWDYTNSTIPLIVNEEAPKGNAQELAQVQDILGTFTTSFSSSGKARSANVTNGCNLINGITLYPGEEFSTLEAITPFYRSKWIPHGSILPEW